MELDQLKTRLKTKLEETAVVHTTRDLEQSIRQKTASVTSRIRSNLWFEFAACAACLLIAVIIWFLNDAVYSRLFCAAAILFASIFSSYLWKLRRRIILYESIQGSLKESLEQLTGIIAVFTRLYFRITIGLLPVIFVMGLITGYLDVSKQGLLQQFQWTKGLTFYISAFIAWSVITWFFSRWYIRRLYGNYLLQLKQQLKEIENG